MTLRHDVITLQQQDPDLVGQGGAITDQAVTHPMQGLNVELFLTLEFLKAHGRSCRSLRDRFGIAVIVLLPLHLSSGGHNAEERATGA